ncbi:hypothetical protein [Sphingobacterium bovistauri]|uniref:Uncharacterized protein n=1 Tax=Sphingobacterium bovistauri TaxID=2781959 RepID=A0ABS7Z5J2_9SPHI|nr:hypothetical protein [Sphingobacterium bovistauri]MCA5005443.1 hypothetical protein [Sphingobacterium bovistauri]
MAIISKDAEVQEELITIYELLLRKRSTIQNELKSIRKQFEKQCDLFILNGYNDEKSPIITNKIYHKKFIEYDTHCHIIDIINDFKDVYGYFPEYCEMYYTLHQTMLQFADNEDYECAAFVKSWVDQISQIIRIKS